MAKITNHQRWQVYTKALYFLERDLKENNFVHSICTALSKAYMLIMREYLPAIDIAAIFHELNEFKPPHLTIDDYWWAKTTDGHTERIKVLKQIIKNL